MKKFKNLMNPYRFFLCIVIIGILIAGCSDKDKRTPPRSLSMPDLSLIDELPMADVIPETGEIDFSFNPSYRFLEEGWWKHQKDKNDVHYCWVRGTRATVRPFFVNPKATICEIDFWPLIYPQAIQLGVQLRINGQILGEKKVPRIAEYQTFGWNIPEGVLQRGWNDMELVFDDARIPARVQSFSDIQVPYSARVSRIAFLQKSGQEFQSPATRDEIVRAEELGNKNGRWNILKMQAPSRVSYHYDLPDDCILQFQRNSALYPGHYRAGLRRAGESEEILLDDNLSAGTDDWQESRLGIGRGGPLELYFESDTGEVVWLEPGLVTEGRPVGNIWMTAFVAEISQIEGDESPQAVWEENLPPLILIYLTDTLRADHLQPYGYPKKTSPFLNQFSREALVYDLAYSSSSWTKSSVASLFTGLYPTAINMTKREDHLPKDLRTLAEYFQGRGYQTFGITTNSYISEKFSMVRGFEKFIHLPERPRSRNVNVASDEMLQVFKMNMSTFDPERPLFVYLHSTDPHGPYELGRTLYQDWSYRDMPRTSDTKKDIAEIYNASWGGDEKGRRHFVDYYDAEVYFNDQTFGQLLDLLKSRGLYDDSVIIFTSDHGEEFFEHGWIEHGKTLYEEVLRIPLIVKWPEAEGYQGHIEHTVSLVDILPSFQWWIEGKMDVSLHGQPLPVENFAQKKQRILYAETSIDHVLRRALLKNQDKVIWSAHAIRALKEPGPWVERFDLQEDPMEQTNLASDQPVETGLRRQAVAEWERVFEEDSQYFQHEGQMQEIDEETLERLEAMGYVGR